MRTMRFTLLALAASLASAGAAAQSSSASPYYVGITQDFTHQSNVLTGPNNSETSDTVSTTTLRGGLNALFGRQRAYANAQFSNVRYSNVDGLNNTSYNLGVGLDWATVERISGSLAATSDRRQADFTSGISTATLKNTQRSDDVDAKVRWGGESLLGLEAGLGSRRVTFSAPEFAAQQYRQNRGNAGLTYRPSGSLTLGAGVATQRTEFLTTAVGQSQTDASKRNDVYGTATWVATGASTLNARINVGKTEYDQNTLANFDGVTGSLGWAWKPTGRLALNTTIARDTGQDAGFRPSSNGTTVPNAANFSRVTDTLAIGANYELTGKIALNGEASTARRSGVAAGLGSIAGSDTTNRLSLGAQWAATRVISAGCNVGRETRSASGAGTYDYTNDRVGCFVSATLD